MDLDPILRESNLQLQLKRKRTDCGMKQGCLIKNTAEDHDIIQI